MWKAAPRVVLARPSIAASLVGWSWATVRAAQSPTTTCTGAARHAQSHHEGGPVVVVALALEPGNRVDPGHEKGRHQEAGQVHVDELVGQEGTEERVPRPG